MIFTSYQFFLAGLMLITGTLNTVTSKWADIQEAHFCNASLNATEFQHPFLQAMGLFIGEFLCFLAFKFVWYSTAQYRITASAYKGNTSSAIVKYWPININKNTRLTDGDQDFNPIVLWIPALLEMISACLSLFALNFISAGTYQMLRGSVMVFTAVFSFVFLKKKLTLIQWLGICIIIVGLIVVGLVSTLSVGSSGSSKSNTGQQILGVILLISAMVFTGLHMVYQENFVGRYNIPPLQLIGWEGILGFISLSLLLIPLNFITWHQSHASPDHRFEHLPSAFCQMADNYIIIIALIANTFSLGLFNFSGVSVTKELSSTTRVVLDNCRTVVIYIISVTVFKAHFNPFDILGLVLIVIGVGTYTGLWTHLYNRYTLSKGSINDETQMVSDDNKYAINASVSSDLNTP